LPRLENPFTLSSYDYDGKVTVLRYTYKNTSRVALQHMQAITPVNITQSNGTHVPLTIENLDDSLEKELGNITIGDYELEDED
jgi:hypothetical protein